MLIPENTYRATVVEAAVGNAGTGTRQVALLWEVNRGPYEARRITWRGHVNTVRNAKRTAKTMAVCNYDGRKATSMLGAEADIVVRHDTYNGKEYAVVAFVNPIAKLVVKEQLDQAEETALLQALGDLAYQIASTPYDPETGEVLEPKEDSADDDKTTFWPR